MIMTVMGRDVRFSLSGAAWRAFGRRVLHLDLRSFRGRAEGKSACERERASFGRLMNVGCQSRRSHRPESAAARLAPLPGDLLIRPVAAAAHLSSGTTESACIRSIFPRRSVALSTSIFNIVGYRRLVRVHFAKYG